MKQQLERKSIEKLEKETSDMLYFGLWQSADQVENELRKIDTKKEKEESLKVQLRFRKNVFGQKCEEKPNVFVFSKQVERKRVPLSVNELKENVLDLIQNSYETPPPEQEHILVGKSIDHKRFIKGEPKRYPGTVISQVHYNHDPPLYGYKHYKFLH